MKNGNEINIAIENGTSPEKTRRVYGHYLHENNHFSGPPWATTHRVLIREIGNGINGYVPDNDNGGQALPPSGGQGARDSNEPLIGNGIVETQCIASLRANHYHRPRKSPTVPSTINRSKNITVLAEFSNSIVYSIIAIV